MISTWRQAWGPVMSLVQPIIWILLFGSVFSSLGALPQFGGAGYIDYLVPGILMMTVLYSGAWAGTGYIDDINSGVMDQYLTSPVSRTAIISGQLAQQLIINVAQSLVVLGHRLARRRALPGRHRRDPGRARRRDAARDDLLLRLDRGGADRAQPDRADQPVAAHRAAGDVPVDDDDARRPHAGVGAERLALEPDDLGGRARPRRPERRRSRRTAGGRPRASRCSPDCAFFWAVRSIRAYQRSV